MREMARTKLNIFNELTHNYIKNDGTNYEYKRRTKSS